MKAQIIYIKIILFTLNVKIMIEIKEELFRLQVHNFKDIDLFVYFLFIEITLFVNNIKFMSVNVNQLNSSSSFHICLTSFIK